MRLEGEHDVILRMRSMLVRARSREIGGVLMGEQLGEDHFRIVDFSVDNLTGGFAHFVREPDHHRVALAAFFERTDANYARYNYLGEWHSHPNFPVHPSLEDCRSMTSLVEGERGIEFAVLMIVRLRFWFKVECSTNLFVRGQEPRPATFSVVKSDKSLGGQRW